jgi:hypothetical protein
MSFLTALLVSHIVLQGLDVHSTLRGLERGAVETNVLMRPAVKSRATFIVVKSLGTAGVTTLFKKAAKRKPRAAIWTLLAANVGYAVVIARNYRR